MSSDKLFSVSDVWERLKNPPSWVEDKFHEQQKCDDRNVHTEARDKFSSKSNRLTITESVNEDDHYYGEDYSALSY